MVRKGKKKKKLRVDPEGVAHIKSTFNNTSITLTDTIPSHIKQNVYANWDYYDAIKEDIPLIQLKIFDCMLKDFYKGKWSIDYLFTNLVFKIG